MSTMVEDIACRWCGGAARFRFTRTVLDRFETAYFECDACRSLQTSEPYWLEEAYRSDTGRSIDVGVVQRCLYSSIVSASILEALGITSVDVCLDWGGGTGLFTRFMRDRGFNFVSYDRYTKAIHAPTFSTDSAAGTSAVITAFEVFEHLPRPCEDLAALFTTKPAAVIFSTEIYEGQGSDWRYLAPEGGQHVFFYSRSALRGIGERFGYDLFEVAHLKLFLSTRHSVKHDVAGGPVERWSTRWRRRLRAHRRVARGNGPRLTLSLLTRDSNVARDIALEGLVNHLVGGDAWKHVEADAALANQRARELPPQPAAVAAKKENVR